MGDADERFSTGVRYLDMEVGGGVPVGDIVTLTAPPDAQTEVLFQELARVQPIQYVSTICDDEAELREWVTPSEGASENDITVGYDTADDLLADPASLVDRIRTDTCVVIDPVDLLETAGRAEYLRFLNAVKERLRAVGSIGFLNCLAGETTPACRPLTFKRADHVWHLRRSVDTNEVTTTLLITKARGNSVPQEGISIVLDEQVRIDTSRNIA